MEMILNLLLLYPIPLTPVKVSWRSVADFRKVELKGFFR